MKAYADLHCDTIWQCYRHQSGLDDPALNLKRNPQFAHLQTYAIYIPDGTEDPYAYFRSVYAYGEEVMRRYPEMILCRNGQEIDDAFETGKTPYIYGVEGGGFFGEDMLKNEKTIRRLKRNGVAFISLCYNDGNHLAGGTKVDFGLSSLGKEVALMLRNEGITVDVSHLNHRSTDEMLEILPDHVIATHSNCYALKEHPRNLTDSQIKELILRGGLIGVNFCHHFLSAPEDARVSDIVEHIAHIIELGGEKAAAIGGDFDGMSRVPSDLRDLYEIVNLGAALEKRFGSDLAGRILYGNVKNYIDRVL
jgi:membrane dipeptidase